MVNLNSATAFCRELDEAKPRLTWALLLDTIIEIREAAIRDGYHPYESPAEQALSFSVCRRPVSRHMDDGIVIMDADHYTIIAALP